MIKSFLKFCYHRFILQTDQFYIFAELHAVAFAGEGSINSIDFNPVYSVYNKLGFFLFGGCRIFNVVLFVPYNICSSRLNRWNESA